MTFSPPSISGGASGFAPVLRLLLAALVGFACAEVGRADATGVTLPSANLRTVGSDSFVFPSGVKCRQAIGAPGPYVDAGFAAEYWTGDKPRFASGNDSGQPSLGMLGYVRVVIPFSKPPPRINCAKLFEIGLSYLQHRLTKPAGWTDPRRDPQPQHAEDSSEAFVLRNLLRRIPARSIFRAEAGDPAR